MSMYKGGTVKNCFLYSQTFPCASPAAPLPRWQLGVYSKWSHTVPPTSLLLSLLIVSPGCSLTSRWSFSRLFFAGMVVAASLASLLSLSLSHDWFHDQSMGWGPQCGQRELSYLTCWYCLPHHCNGGCDPGWLTRVSDSLGQSWSPSPTKVRWVPKIRPLGVSIVCAHQNPTQRTLSCLLQCS